jgi:flavin reductase (DIM6/NTAB) family NADH-FMN oxidoreductase RutF
MIEGLTGCRLITAQFPYTKGAVFAIMRKRARDAGRRAVYVICILFVRGSCGNMRGVSAESAWRACNTPKSASTCCTPEPKTIDLFVGYQRFIFHTQIPIAPP